jgi:hypothetical protein
MVKLHVAMFLKIKKGLGDERDFKYLEKNEQF